MCSKTSIRINEPDEEGVGEIWIKGDNVFQGYYKDPEATAASFEDGWFKTGDFGKLTASNELFISGRKKSLIILDNGKNVFPEDIEFGLMDNISYVREAVALESEQVINGHNTKIIASVLYVEPSDFPDKTDDEILKIVKTDVADVNRKMPSYKKVTDVVLLIPSLIRVQQEKLFVQKQPKDTLTVKKDRNMIDKLKTILTEYVDIDPETITEDTNIRSDLGLNSLELVNIAVAVENTFDVEIPDREISRIETVKDVIDVLTEYIDEE